MTTDLNEQVAIKMGWVHSLPADDTEREIEGSEFWIPPNGYYCDLLNFSGDWNATIILIKFAWNSGFDYEIVNKFRTDDLGMIESYKVFRWYHEEKNPSEAEIFDHKTDKAACQAFLLIPDEDLKL